MDTLNVIVNIVQKAEVIQDQIQEEKKKQGYHLIFFLFLKKK